MAGRRLPRLNEQLRRDIAELLRTHVRDPRVAGVTVTDVSVTNDLSLARVYVRVAGGEAELAEAMVGLEAASVFIRRSVGDGMRIRRVPELRFEVDSSGDHAARIEALLREVVPPGGFPPEEEDGLDPGDAGPEEEEGEGLEDAGEGNAPRVHEGLGPEGAPADGETERGGEPGA
jgi:ribosome-binding factor A